MITQELMLFLIWFIQDFSDASSVVRVLYCIILAKLELCFLEFLSLCGFWLGLARRHTSVILEGRNEMAVSIIKSLQITNRKRNACTVLVGM